MRCTPLWAGGSYSSKPREAARASAGPAWHAKRMSARATSASRAAQSGPPVDFGDLNRKRERVTSDSRPNRAHVHAERLQRSVDFVQSRWRPRHLEVDVLRFGFGAVSERTRAPLAQLACLRCVWRSACGQRGGQRYSSSRANPPRARADFMPARRVAPARELRGTMRGSAVDLTCRILWRALLCHTHLPRCAANRLVGRIRVTRRNT